MAETLKYEEIFAESWEELCRKYNSNEFKPYQELDIVCLLYHLCLERLKDAKLIHATSGWGFDFTIGEIHSKSNQSEKPDKTKYQDLTHCLIVEVKHIKREGRKARVLVEAFGDIEKLAEGNAQSSVLAIFDEVGSMEEGEVKELNENGKIFGVNVYCYRPKSKGTSPA